jgi:hypothetical protein
MLRLLGRVNASFVEGATPRHSGCASMEGGSCNIMYAGKITRTKSCQPQQANSSLKSQGTPHPKLMLINL